MSKVATIEISMEKRLQDMPHVILFEIFRKLPKDKLIEISTLCLKFKDVAEDTRLWKNVFIQYGSRGRFPDKMYAFEDLYSGPWPVKVIDLSWAKINPPVTSQIDQIIKVAMLDLSSIKADEATIAAILTKYQCKELYLFPWSDSVTFSYKNIVLEAISSQTALEAFSLGAITRYRDFNGFEILDQPISDIHQWLSPVLRNCKKLKTLDLRYLEFSDFSNLDMLNFVKNLPPSLEKLLLAGANPEDYFFELLAESTPNMKELELSNPQVKCRSLLKFKFLEALHVIPDPNPEPSVPKNCENISDLHTYLIKFPALKTVYIGIFSEVHTSESIRNSNLDRHIGKLGRMLQPYGIIVETASYPESSPYPEDGNNLWNVS